MLRYFAGVASALLLVAAGIFVWKAVARADNALPRPSAAPPMVLAPAATETALPRADRDRETKRFDRYDKDRDEAITREEYLGPRRKTWTKLDSNGDGRLSFEEWAAKTIDKYEAADADHSSKLSRTEFATTRVQRKSKPSCVCRPADDGEN